MASVPELQDRLEAAAREAAGRANLRPDRSARRRLGALAGQAAKTLGADAAPADVSRAEESFGRLAREVAARAEPAGAAAGNGEEAMAERDAPRLPVSAEHIDVALDGLCPGFFPFC